MRDNKPLLSNVKLALVPMAGTHDSGTYRLGKETSYDMADALTKLPSILHGIFRDFAQAQVNWYLSKAAVAQSPQFPVAVVRDQIQRVLNTSLMLTNVCPYAMTLGQLCTAR